MFGSTGTAADANAFMGSTQHPTSRTLEKSSDQKETHSMADSAYQSMADDSAPSATSEVPTVSAGSRPLPLKGSDLRHFRKQPVHNHQFRYYENIKFAIEARLQTEVVAFGREPWHHMALHAKVIGRNKQDSTVHVVVFCAPYLEDLLNSVFTKREVQLLLTIPHTTTTLSHLVIPVPPASTSAKLDIDVCCQTSYVSAYDTHCGAPIIFRAGGSDPKRKFLQQATFGGIVKVSYGSGEVRYFGMSAGHVLEAPCEQDPRPSTAPYGLLSTHNAFGVAGWISNDNVLGKPLDPRQLPAITANRASLAYDWCLFGVAEPHINRALHPSTNPSNAGIDLDRTHLILVAERPHLQDDTSDSVLLLGAVAGSRRGEISDVSSRIWLANSDCFVDAYVFEPKNSNEVLEGDSGAWVVHAGASELYGHVVATSIFGDAYVLPAIDAFENMRKCLGAVSVTLPTTSDLPIVPPTQLSDSTMHPVKSATQRRKGGNNANEGHLTTNKTHAVLRKSKVWDPPFYEEINDISFLEAIRTLEPSLDIVDAFLLHAGLPNTRLKIEQERKYLEDAGQKNAQSGSLVHLDERFRESGQKFSKWLTADELRARSTRSVGRTRDPSTGYRRKLVFVPNVDAKSISALIESVSWFEAKVLRYAVHNHTTSAILLAVNEAAIEFPHYRLEFHLPYFHLSDSSETNAAGTENSTLGFKLLRPFGNLGSPTMVVHSLHTTVVISGANEHKWVGYAFGTIDSEEIDHGNDGSSPCDDASFSVEEDFFATGGCDCLVNPAAMTWDPRNYFLRTVEIRLRCVVREHEYLIRTLRNICNDWTPKFSDLQSRSTDLSTITAMIHLLNHLLDCSQETGQAWKRFSSCDGDISYFSDKCDPEALKCLGKIDGCFERLEMFERDILKMIKHAKYAMSILQFQVSQEKNNAIYRSMTSFNLRAAEHRKSAAVLAHRAAIDQASTSRATRVNVQLFMVVTAVVIALQYFTSESELFAFERNARTFGISVGIVISFLFSLALILYIMDGVWNALSARLNKSMDPDSPTSSSSSLKVSNAGTHHYEKHGTIV